MQLLVTLCARGGSKGIPGKNIKSINGLPLLAYSIRHARQFAAKFGADIALSTDGADIKEVARQQGLETTYIRPESVSLDGTGKIETIKHLLLWEEQQRGKRYDMVLDLDVSAPLRNLDDLEAAFQVIRSDENALNLFSVNKAHRNPYFNMVERQDNGYYGLVKTGSFLTRQSAPEVYDLNASFYFFRRPFFDAPAPKTISDRSLIYVMPHLCFDLDHPIDFEFMEYLMVHQKLDFAL